MGNHSREELLKNLQKQTGASLESLQSDLENTVVDEREKIEINTTKTIQSTEKNKIMLAEQFILVAYLFHHKYTQNYDISKLTFENDIHKKIAAYIYEKQKNGQEIYPSSLFDIFPENTVEINLLFEEKNMQVFDEDSVKYFQDCVTSILKANNEKKRIALVNESMTCVESARKMAILKEIQQLTEEYKNF